MFEWKVKDIKATNAIFLAETGDDEGRPFKSRFLQAGLVKYDFGVCLLKKETIDKFVNTFIKQPVIIGHKDDIKKDDVVGYVHNIWFSPEDGWFWCDGKLTDKEAIEKVEKGFNVSCQYRITEYSNNTDKKLHNGNPYDKEILSGIFEHLAIVENPRYEDAFIAVNAYIAENAESEEIDWITIKGNHIPIEKNKTKKEVVKEFIEEKQEKKIKKEIKYSDSYGNKYNFTDEDDINDFIDSNNLQTYGEFKEAIKGIESKEERKYIDKYASKYVYADSNGKSVSEYQKERNKIIKERNKIVKELNQIKEYKEYSSFENDYKEYIEKIPPSYEITDIETTAKDLGITKDKGKTINTPIEDVEITYDTIEHLYTREDKKRPLSINKMLNTLERPLIVNEIEGKKYYFKVFKSDDKSQGDITIVSPDDKVFTNIPTNRKNWFLKILKLGKTIFNILTDKQNKRRKSDNNITHANNSITDYKTNFKPKATNSFVEQFKDVLYETIAEGIVKRLGELKAQNYNKNHDKYGKFCKAELKGQKAIEQMLIDKKGTIKNAFYRKDIGHIDLVWGDGSKGLSHIIKRREKDEKQDIKEFLSDLTDVIQNGTKSEKLNEKGRWEISLNGKMAIIEPIETNGERTFLLSAFKKRT